MRDLGGRPTKLEDNYKGCIVDEFGPVVRILATKWWVEDENKADENTHGT